MWDCEDAAQCDDEVNPFPNTLPDSFPTLPTLPTTEEPPTTSESSSSTTTTTGDTTTTTAPTTGDVSLTTGAVDPTDGAPAYCANWNPGASIIYVGGTHWIDEEFFTDLVANPSPLTACEEFYIQSLPNGGFSFERLVTGELFYELGVRSNDIPLTLNGMPLNDFADVINAYVQLWGVEAETDYELEVLRGTVQITFEYVLTP